jgi:hypothetical protein
MQAEKTLHRSEIPIAMQQRVDPLDAKGANDQINRSADRISSAAQEPIIRRGFSLAPARDPRAKLIQIRARLFDRPRLRVVAQARQNLTEDEVPTSNSS